MLLIKKLGYNPKVLTDHTKKILFSTEDRTQTLKRLESAK